MRRCLVSIIATSLVAGAVTAASAQQRYSIGSGQTAGVYYLWGGALGKIWSENIDEAQFNVEAVIGGVQSVKLLNAGDLEVAFYNVRDSFESWNQIGDFAGEEYRHQRAMFAMYPSFWVMGALDGKGIDSIDDWKGKTVHFGPANGTVDVIGRNILPALGIEPGRILNSNYPDMPGQVRDGFVDAFAAVGGQPWPPFVDIATTHKVTWFDFEDRHYEKIFQVYSYFAKETIPANTYDGQDRDYNTFGVWNIVFARDDLPEDLVYRMIKAVDENVNVLMDTHPSTAKYFELSNIARTSPIPLHPGVIRYLREKNIEIAEKLIPPEMKN